MLRKIVAATLIALSITSPAFARAGKVKEVTVEADLSAIKNAEAAQYWTNMSADLQNAIAAGLADRLDDKNGSVVIRVNVDTVRLADAWKSPVMDSKLSGRVVMRDETDATEGSVYDLTVTMDQAKVFLPENFAVATLAVDSREYYSAMIAAFADAVVKDYRK